LLDAAVAKAEGFELMEILHACWICPGPGEEIVPFGVSSDAGLADSIIFRERIVTEVLMAGEWRARCEEAEMLGPTRFVAAMRAYVVSRFGHSVDLPDVAGVPVRSR
jgi:hypothetical protein